MDKPRFAPEDFPEIRRLRPRVERFTTTIFQIAERFVIISGFYAAAHVTHSWILTISGISLALLLTIHEAMRASRLLPAVYDLRTRSKKISTQGRFLQAILLVFIGVFFIYAPHLLGSAMIDFARVSH